MFYFHVQISQTYKYFPCDFIFRAMNIFICIWSNLSQLCRAFKIDEQSFGTVSLQEYVEVSIKSESMQKSTKIADSWQGSKSQNRSSFADW